MKVQKLIDTYDFELLTNTNTDVEIKGLVPDNTPSYNPSETIIESNPMLDSDIQDDVIDEKIVYIEMDEFKYDSIMKDKKEHIEQSRMWIDSYEKRINKTMPASILLSNC